MSHLQIIFCIKFFDFQLFSPLFPVLLFLKEFIKFHKMGTVTQYNSLKTSHNSHSLVKCFLPIFSFYFSFSSICIRPHGQSPMPYINTSKLAFRNENDIKMKTGREEVISSRHCRTQGGKRSLQRIDETPFNWINDLQCSFPNRDPKQMNVSKLWQCQ